MPKLPTTHTAENEELAALYALNLLDGAELTEFRRHLARCARCYSTAQQDQIVLSMLNLAAPEMDPAPGLRDRLLERAAREL
jgi:Putative zinc-finger